MSFDLEEIKEAIANVNNDIKQILNLDNIHSLQALILGELVMNKLNKEEYPF